MTEDPAMSDTPAVKLTNDSGQNWTRDDLAKGLMALDGLRQSEADIEEYRERADSLMAHLSLASTINADKGRALLDALKEEGEGR